MVGKKGEKFMDEGLYLTFDMSFMHPPKGSMENLKMDEQEVWPG